MTMLYMDGFDAYADVADIRRRTGYDGNLGTTVTGRNGTGKAIQMGSSGRYRAYLPSAETRIITGLAWRSSDVGGTSHSIIDIREGSTIHLTLYFETDGGLRLYRGSSSGTVLGSAYGVMLTQSWHYIEFDCTINDSTGAFQVWVDGVSVMSGSGVDTRNGGSVGQITQVTYDQDNATDPQLDDLYILNTSGLTNNARLGDVTIETLLPTSDGSTTDFSPDTGLTNYTQIDDGGTPDDDTTYISSSTLNHTDLHGYGNLTLANINTVHCVSVLNHARKEDAGTREIRALARNGLTTGEAAAKALGTEYRFVEGIFETNPDGGGAWTEATVNSAEFGITIES